MTPNELERAARHGEDALRGLFNMTATAQAQSSAPVGGYTGEPPRPVDLLPVIARMLTVLLRHEADKQAWTKR